MSQTGIFPASRVTIEEIRSQWDSIAETRNRQLRYGKDISFECVLKPAVLKLMEGADLECVLDAGCGTGVLSEVVSSHAVEVIGIDISPKSIALASESTSRPENVKYLVSSIEELSGSEEGKYSLILANMVLQDVANLDACLAALAKVAKPGGCLVATITHPWFWPSYWGYVDEPWFNYSREQAIQAPFVISSEADVAAVTTHFHRPLSAYFEGLGRAGFCVEELLEPIPEEKVQHAYPAIWKFPRFLAFRCRR